MKETGTVEASLSTVIYAKSSGQVKTLNFAEGDRVKKGQLILSTDANASALTIESMKQQAAGLAIQLEQARKTAVRTKELYSQGAISQTEYEAAVSTQGQLEKQLSSLNYSIASAKDSADSSGIISPMDGVITGLNVQKFDSLVPGAPIIEISDLSNIYVTINLITKDAETVKIGNKAIILTDEDVVIDENAKVKTIGIKAHDVISSLGISQKRVKVEISPSGLDGLILGSDVQVKVVSSELKNVLRIDNKAIFEMNKKNYTYVIKSGKALQTEVVLGIKGDDFSEIKEGLAEDDVVIISPSNSISDGTKVKATTI